MRLESLEGWGVRGVRCTFRMLANPDFRCLGGLGGWRSKMLGIDFGGPIEEKVAGLEGCHVAFEVRLICVYHEFAQVARGLSVPSSGECWRRRLSISVAL